jgi:hypothetical protein
VRTSKLRCPYCRQPAMSWLHVGGIITAFAAAVLFYVLKVL